MRNLHTWKTTTDDGEKREVRAEKFGKRWRLQAKVKGEENWTYYDDPLLPDLLELREVEPQREGVRRPGRRESEQEEGRHSQTHGYLLRRSSVCAAISQQEIMINQP